MVEKDGSPETPYKPNVYVRLTGDADFTHLPTLFRRRVIRVEVSTTQTLDAGLKSTANEVIDISPLLAPLRSLF